MASALVLLAGCALALLWQKISQVWKALRSINRIPGYIHFVSQYGLVANLFPRIPILNPGTNHFFTDKYEPFKAAGWDITSIIVVFPTVSPVIVVADAEVIKEVVGSRSRFPKPVKQYDLLALYGPNIVTTEGEQWKRYRKISAPAFSDRNNKLVWNQSFRIWSSLCDDIWRGQSTISVDNCQDIMLPFALFVIAAAGFGKTVTWQEDDVKAQHHRMTFKKALSTMCTDVFLKLFLPDPLLDLTQRTRTVKVAYEELAVYMKEMIQERTASEKLERDDLLSSLLAANSNDFDREKLTDDELMGNIYIFLLAGHETSAHTLTFMFGLLALYPDEQEKLHQHIKSLTLNGKQPSYEDLSKFTYAMAVINETLRMFPVAVNLPKICAQDTTLSTKNIRGERLVVPIPEGAGVYLDIAALHYNPRYWKDSHTFNPSRFLEDWPKDAFIPFAGGARACIGRRFFESEAVATLVTLIPQFKVSVKEEPQFAGETFTQRKDRVLRTSNAVTLTPVRVPITFTRRQ